MSRRLLLLAWLLASPALGAGSWVGQAGPVGVFMADRPAASSDMAPPAAVGGGVIRDVRWRYSVPPGQAVVGWLCHAEGCTELSGPRGQSRSLSGMPAGTPLHFRFALAPGQRTAARVSELQVIVNYR